MDVHGHFPQARIEVPSDTVTFVLLDFAGVDTFSSLPDSDRREKF